MVLSTILGVFFGRSTDDGGAEALKAALREPRKDVDLYGVFQEPQLDPQGANTAKFPVNVYDAGSEEQYEETAVEFAIESDTGKQRLEEFLYVHGIKDMQNLDAIEGEEANVERAESGNITVDW
jgi:hypothetical protein